MEELTIDDLQEVQTNEAPALIQVVQLPVLSQSIDQKSWEIEKKVDMALHMAVSPETLAEVKKVRAELNKESAELQDQFRQVKEAVLAPWNEVEEKWKGRIKGQYAAADSALKQKISEVESGIIGACLEEMQSRFEELKKTRGLDWLQWGQLGIKVGLTEAKQKTYKKIWEVVQLNVSGIAQDVEAIAAHEDAAEIMSEYKRCLSLGQAIGTVQERHRRIEEEEARQKAQEERRQAEAEAAAKVQAAAATVTPAPVVAPAPIPVAQEKVYRLNFSICGTKPQLVEFKKHLIEYAKKEGLEL